MVGPWFGNDLDYLYLLECHSPDQEILYRRDFMSSRLIPSHGDCRAEFIGRASNMTQIRRFHTKSDGMIWQRKERGYKSTKKRTISRGHPQDQDEIGPRQRTLNAMM
jgi:hypothetical protein